MKFDSIPTSLVNIQTEALFVNGNDVKVLRNEIAQLILKLKGCFGRTAWLVIFRFGVRTAQDIFN